MHRYRSHTCSALRESHVGETVRLSGWIHRRRDHGQLVFIDLRDHYGITQCVTDVEDPALQEVEKVRLQSVVCITGRVGRISPETIKASLDTGPVTVRIDHFVVLPAAAQVPLRGNSDED